MLSSPKPSKNAFSSSGGAKICDDKSSVVVVTVSESPLSIAAFSKAASVSRICFARSKFFKASEKFKCSNILLLASSENKIDINAHVSLSSLDTDGSMLCALASHKALSCCSSFDLTAASNSVSISFSSASTPPPSMVVELIDPAAPGLRDCSSETSTVVILITLG